MLRFRLFMFIMLLLSNAQCDTQQPGVADVRFNKPIPDHTRFTAPCSSCHEETRLPPTTDIDSNQAALVTAHGFGRNCGECHEYNAAAPTWKPLSHAHGSDTSCLGCHSIAGEAATHAARGDCVSCHAYPKWKPGP